MLHNKKLAPGERPPSGDRGMKGCLISLDTLSPWLKVVDWIPCIVASVLCVCVCVSLWGGGREWVGGIGRKRESCIACVCLCVCVCVCVCVCARCDIPIP